MTASSDSLPDIGGPSVSERPRLARFVGPAVVLLALVTSVVSFLILTGQTSIQPTPLVVKTAATIDGLVVLGLIGLVAYEASGLWLARRRGRAHSFPMTIV